ncbi:MAG: 57, gp57 [Herbinix sp.]|jgi:hypothetical protein|nr:57, gp57 [Herbinix sp.]
MQSKQSKKRRGPIKMAAEKEEKKDLPVGNATFSFDAFSEFATESGVTGLEVLDNTDLKLPKFKIVQMTSEEFTKDNITPGKFYNTVTKESFDTLECILLAVGKSRVMWPAQFKRGDKPLCRSFDGKEKTEGCGDGVCSSCQYSQWPKDDSKGKDNKPPCTMGYVWLAMDSENHPFRLSAQGSSVSPTKDFLNAIAPKLRRGKKQLGIFIFKMALTTEKLSNDKGTYYVLKYNEPIGTIDPADYKTVEEMSDSLRAIFLQAIDKDTATMDAADYGDGDAASDGAAPDAAVDGKPGNSVLF